MGFNFPNTPTVGDLYPTPALPGVPQYRWDGAVWTTTTYDPLTWVQRAGDTMTGALNVVTPPTLPAHAASKAYVDAYAVAAAPLDALNYSGMQINGGMEISQEKGGTGITNVAGYVCDGWKFGFSGGMGFQVLADNGGGTVFYTPYRLLAIINTAAVALGANDYSHVLQYIEGWRILRLQWGTANARPITVGFWTAHTRTGIYSIAIQNGPTANRSYVATYTQAAAAVAQYNVITIPGDTTGSWAIDNGAALTVIFSMGAGSTYTAPVANSWQAGNYIAAPGQVNAVGATTDRFRITGVVVLPGIYAPTAAQSPLIMRPYDQELMTCQRYWQKSYDYGTALTSATSVGAIGIAALIGSATAVAIYGTGFRFPVRMRSGPTIKAWSVTGAANLMRLSTIAGVFDVAFNASNTGETGVQAVYCSTGLGGLTAGQACELLFHYAADTRL